MENQRTGAGDPHRPPSSQPAGMGDTPTEREDATFLDGVRDAAREAGSGARRFVDEAGGELRRRVERRAHRGLDRAADQLTDTADRLDRFAEARLHGTRTEELAHSAATLIERTAEYLRQSDLDSLHAELERHVREKPVQTLLLAVGVGWFIGKIMKAP